MLGERPTIPLTVLGGYLGAGKTTLLNHILQQNVGQRIAVLVNDFGSINIDSRLIAAHDGDTISLTNGCICCSLANGFLSALTQVRDRPDPPDHVIVEASGVADPARIGQYGHLPGFRPDGILVLVDVVTIRARSRDKYVGKTILRQVRAADLIVLTKTDLVDSETVVAVQSWLHSLAPEAQVMVTDGQALPMAIVLGVGSATRERPALADDDHEDGHVMDYRTWTVRQDDAIEDDAFRAMIDALPDGVLRGKGIVQLASAPEQQTLFQLVGKRWSLLPGAPWGYGPRTTELVFIALPDGGDDSPLSATLDDLLPIAD